MYDQLISFVSNPSTQEEFRSFLQEYHKVLTSKHKFKPLKLGHALHAAAEAMKKESWHHISGDVNDGAPTDGWGISVYDNGESVFNSFASKQDALSWLWKELAPRLKKKGLYDEVTSKLDVQENKEPSSFMLSALMNQVDQVIRQRPEAKIYYLAGRLTTPSFQEMKLAQAKERMAKSAQMSCYELTLADDAGWLLVEAPSLLDLEAHLESVKNLVVNIAPVAHDSQDRTDVYFLGEDCYRSSLADVVAKLHKKRKLWWIAESPQEAEEWAEELKTKGARIIRVEASIPTKPTGRMDVVFEVEPAQSGKLASTGELTDPNDYLDEDLTTL